jgi:multidrug efflux pump subunit AcrA (membrane-fusion protein)
MSSRGKAAERWPWALPAAFTTISSIALAAVAVALITLGGYSRRVDMEGTVLPNIGVVELTASSPGRVETLTVQEGQAVKKGAPLYMVDLDTTTKDGGAQQRIIDAQSGERDVLVQEIERKTRMSEETEKELRQKIDQLQLQIRKVDEQIVRQPAATPKDCAYLKGMHIVPRKRPTGLGSSRGQDK